LYFGLSIDQTTTFKVSPTGGTGPYAVKISINRNLLCNQVNGAGDETWVSTSSGGTRKDTNSVCSTTLNSGFTRTVNTAIASGGYLQVSATLLDTTLFTISVTDANGCTYTRQDWIFGEDVRCFAGNSSVKKYQLCHQTGSAKNPCVSICVDSSALAEHLAHGDSLGPCPKNGCGTAYYNTSPVITETINTNYFDAKVSPNPSVIGTPFTLTVTGNNNNNVDVRVLNMLGKEVYTAKGSANQVYKFGGLFTSGVYFVEVVQNNQIKVLKIIKQ
jgi:hypothetical protein